MMLWTVPLQQKSNFVVVGLTNPLSNTKLFIDVKRLLCLLILIFGTNILNDLLCQLQIMNIGVKKIARNVARDKKVTTELTSQGWKVIRIWEYDVKHNFEKSIQKIVDAISK